MSSLGIAPPLLGMNLPLWTCSQSLLGTAPPLLALSLPSMCSSHSEKGHTLVTWPHLFWMQLLPYGHSLTSFRIVPSLDHILSSWSVSPHSGP